MKRPDKYDQPVAIFCPFRSQNQLLILMTLRHDI